MQAGDQIVVRVEKPVAGGDMLARHDGRVVFVSGAIPDEVVRARIGRVMKGHAHAATVEVLEPSPDRRDVSGDPACGGTTYAHVAYRRQLELKRQVIVDAFDRLARTPVPEALDVIGADLAGHRMRARLRVGAGGILGFVREGTHDVCDPAQTGQLTGPTLDSLGHLAEWFRRVRWRQTSVVDVSENLPGDQRAVHVEAREAPSGSAREQAALSNEGFTGLCWSHARTGRAETLWGSPYVADALGELVPALAEGAFASSPVRRHVRSFFQSNRHLVGRLVEEVVRHAGGTRAVDLYAGVGLNALALAAHGCEEATAVEGDRLTGQDLHANAAPLGGRVRVRRGAVERYVRAGGDPVETVVVNPPRTGLSPAVRAGVVGLAVERLVYVSCDVATLARDVRELRAAGFELAHARAFDLFPNTPHVETLVVLRR